MNKVYYRSIDYMKIVLALLVVGIHTGPFLSVNETLNFVYVQILGRLAVPFFFVASAYFVFHKIDAVKGEGHYSQRAVLKEYLWRITKLYLVWTFVYFIYVLYGWITNGFTISALLRYIRDFFFTGSYYHLWFLPSMIVSTLIVYGFRNKMNEKVLGIIAVLFYLVGMMINVYGDVLMQIPVISTITNLYLKIFVTSRNGLFFGFIFTYMGSMIAQNQSNKKGLMRVWLILLSILYVVEAFAIKKAGYMNDLTSMYLSLIPLEYVLFQYLLCFKSKTGSSVILREMSTLIYVSHIIFCIIFACIPIIVSHSLIYYGVVCVTSILFSVIIIILSKPIRILRGLY